MEQSGWLASNDINEASGMQASHSFEGDFFVHNDEGEPLIYAIDSTGADLGFVSVVPSMNKDWEDMTSVPVEGGRWLVAGDIGDNWSKRESIKLYFAEEPRPGKNKRYAGQQDLKHWLTLTYPDGPRDCETMGYDPIVNQNLLLSKRDRKPRLYGVSLETALTQNHAELTFLGSIKALRAPTHDDRTHWGGRTDWISQPTGFDISPDGMNAVVISYRSLYHYRREQNEDWPSALQKAPVEILGPLAVQNEAVAYSIDGKSIYVTTEQIPAPLFQIQLDASKL